MGSGNYLVDNYDRVMDSAHKCDRCEGIGVIPWGDVEDGIIEMSSKIFVELEKMRIYSKGHLTYRLMLSKARDVRKDGCECPDCEGTGEYYG